MNSITYITQAEDLPALTDKRWVSDGEGIYFLPCYFDILHETYCGYWYITQPLREPDHYNTGILNGYVLQGTLLVKTGGVSQTVSAGSGFAVPPQKIYANDFELHDGKFIMFGAITGKTFMVGTGESFDIQTYLINTKRHYQQHGLLVHEYKQG